MRTFFLTGLSLLMFACGPGISSTDDNGTPAPTDTPKPTTCTPGAAAQSGRLFTTTLQTIEDHCDVGLFFTAGDPMDVTVTGNAIEIEIFPNFVVPGTIGADGCLVAHRTDIYDPRPQYDCVETDTTDIEGGVLADGALDVIIRTRWTPDDGYEAGCVAANGGTHLPCTSAFSMVLTK